MIWKVREMPRWQMLVRAAGRSIVSPAKRTLPSVGLHHAGDQVEQRRLAGAVGPITARTSPASTRMVDADRRRPGRRSAASAPSSSSSAIALGLAAAAARANRARRQAPDPLRREQHEGDEDQAEEQRPGLGPGAELVSTPA